MLRAIRAMLYCLLQHYVQQQVTFLYSTANLGHFSPVLSMTPSLHLPSPLHCGNHCTTTLMNVSCEFYDRRAYLLICAFVSYVEPHFSSFYLLCRSHDNTALTPQPYVVHFFAFVHFALLCVCSHCLFVIFICIFHDTSKLLPSNNIRYGCVGLKLASPPGYHIARIPKGNLVYVNMCH